MDYAAHRGVLQGVPVLHVRGEVDIRSSELLRADLDQIVSGDDDVVVLDLTDVTFLDSTGLHAFDSCLARAGDRGIRVPIVCVQQRVLRLFQITGLDVKYPIYDSVGSAVAAPPNGAR